MIALLCIEVTLVLVMMIGIVIIGAISILPMLRFIKLAKWIMSDCYFVMKKK